MNRAQKIAVFMASIIGVVSFIVATFFLSLLFHNIVFAAWLGSCIGLGTTIVILCPLSYLLD
jgi:hypothetical protein